MKQKIKVVNKTGRSISVHIDYESQFEKDLDFDNRRIRVRTFVIEIEKEPMEESTIMDPSDELTTDIVEFIPVKFFKTRAENIGWRGK